MPEMPFLIFILQYTASTFTTVLHLLCTHDSACFPICQTNFIRFSSILIMQYTNIWITCMPHYMYNCKES